MSPSFVLDVSVAAPWAAHSLATIYTDRVLLKLTSAVVVVPASWPLDLVDRLLPALVRGTVTEQRIEQLFLMLAALQIYVDDEGPFRVWPAMLDLARAHALSVRDAAYLELALRTNLPLATTDATLTRAANAAGVSIFTP